MAQPTRKYGILGHQAPELTVSKWIDGEGKPMKTVQLAQFKEKVVFILTWQSWCPGCHRIGFPNLKKVYEHFKSENKLGSDVVFLAIQTPFEGLETNTFDKLRPTQEEFDLPIPFGHDSVGNYPNLMKDYKTGGTPWNIILDKEHKVVFNNFRIEAASAIKLIEKILNE